MKLTQAQIIKKVLENSEDWVPSYFLIKNDTRWGWLGSGSDRIARYLAEDGEIQRKRDGKFSYYKALEQNFEQVKLI